MRPGLVIFDCDGVLVDTEPTTTAAVSRNLVQYGLEISPEDSLSLFVGGTMQSAMEEAIRLGAELPSDWLDEIYGEMFEALGQGVRVLDGIPEVLDTLDDLAIPYCILSNGPLKKMQVSLGPSGLWDRFEGRIWSPHEHGPAKPDPALLLMAAKALGVAPAQGVMIDDSPVGVIAAQRAGMRAIGFDEAGALGRVNDLDAEVIHNIAELHGLLSLTG